MNFFERQIEVRSTSNRLVLYFALAVIGIVLVIDVVWTLLLLQGGSPPESIAVQLVFVTIGVVAIIAVTSLFRLSSLRSGGGGNVARSLGGVYVAEETTDPRLRRLRNVVEEIAIASGTPVPEVYVLPQEQGINAFAAGWSPSDAAVAVTQGALERLNRDELQGVIAHEFSHVVNGDMKLNIRLIGVLFGILALTVVGRVMLHGARGRNGAPFAVAGLIAIVAGYIGVFFGNLIKAAVSRQREYLADASAVQFTRQTAGLAGALKKIGGLQEGSLISNAKKDDVSHMLFGEGKRFSALYATHPPLPERIKALDPNFDPAELERLRQRWSATPPSGLDEDRLMGLAQPTDRPSVPAGAPSEGPVRREIRPDDVVAGVGDPSAASYERGQQILLRIPQALRERVRRPETAVPVVLGLLLTDHPEARRHQRAVVAQRHGPELADAVWQEAAELRGLDHELRLPLSELAFSALRLLSPQELRQLVGTLSELIRADGRIDVFEFCLSTLLHTGLHEVIYHRAPWQPRRQSLRGGSAQVATLLGVLAQVGNPDPGEAGAAFGAGMARVLPGQRIPFSPPQQGLIALGEVWPVLDGLEGAEKASLVAALVMVIGHDGMMTVDEIELLRTVCGVLHCPLPPLAAGRTGPVSDQPRTA